MFKHRPIALHKRWPVAAVLACCAVVTFVAKGGGTAPAIPAVNLSADPLYAAAGGDKPVLSLALSVEFPTVGAQYTSGGADDATYANTSEYLGYYDAESCYSYNDAPAETPAAGLNTADYKRFDRSGAATNRMCANAFSGNFLNWASNSAIDMLRLALSGGDRYIDETGLTVLQRAVIPNGDPICMWNSTNFPAKQLQKNGGGANKYWGAIPTLMINRANGADVWVANTLNRIYFGLSRTGGCGSTGDYALTGGASIGPVQSSSNAPPSDLTKCGDEGGGCSVSGVKEVWYGGGNHWSYAPVQNKVDCNNAVFGDPWPGYGKACYYRTYSGSWNPSANANTQLNSDGFFFARVSVCAKDASGRLLDNRDYGLCRMQPSGHYKPTGVIQKYSDQLRLAAFGYLLDQTTSASGGRYGGVLRAPMKYVGPKTYDLNGLDNTPTGGNPNAEWDPVTGIFQANPDNDTSQAVPASGVVNYLNKFGRTGAVAGRYKMYDPVGELYYENLRYLQGLQPSAAAVTNITPAMYDGFPVTTSWVDPYGGGRLRTGDYACLKSNIVVIGDINTWDGGPLPKPDTGRNIPDLAAWTRVVQDFEKNAASTYLDGQGSWRITGNPNIPNDGAPGNLIVGAAYWAHTHDIRGADWTASPSQQRPGLRVKTYLFDVNEYGAQNSASTRQFHNQFFTAAKYGGFEADAANVGGKAYNTFGNPFENQDGSVNNDVWQDPARPGEAGSYYLQGSARGVLNAFDSIFSRAASAARSIAGSGLASKNLTQAGNSVYQGTFDTSDWSGDVLAFPITVSNTNVVALATTPSWTANAQLMARTAARNIVVGRVGATAMPVARNFAWNSIDAGLQADLSKATPSSVADGLGSDRLDYLRGLRAKEGNPFRTRAKLLGDNVNSGIVYSGVPASMPVYDATYAQFYDDHAKRTAAIFAGMNDGMLHAFDASSGNELFAYIPSWMGPKLSALTGTGYPSNHQAYVDGAPAVGEARVGATGTAADWKTVLVSGTGAGGPGLFALDVSDPATFSPSSVMWEFTREDDVDMGYVVGKPQILKLRTSARGVAPVYRWFAVVASGVNNYTGADRQGNFSTGSPALFLLALDKAVGSPWALGTNYYKVSLPFDQTVGKSYATGLVNFRPVYGTQGELAQVFMGDLHGSLWKLDFASHGAAEWNANTLSAYVNASGAAYPLYSARTSAGAVQTISMAPTVMAGPVIAGKPTYYVAVGTGKYLEQADKTSTTQNSFYALYDNGTPAADEGAGFSPASVISGRGRLRGGTVSAGAVTVPAFEWGRASSDADTTQRSGWYFDFPAPGEREISNAVVSGDNLIFSSLIPAASGTAGSCAAAGGNGNEYIVNVDAGNGSYKASTVGVLGEPLVLDVGDPTYSATDSTGRRYRIVTRQVIQQGSNGLRTSTSTQVRVVAGRLSWRQINNYQDLKNN